MKKIFDTNENIADKAFTQSIVISVAGIILCIVALCSATYAWFVADVSSSQNTISAAFFDVEVTVYDITQIMTTQSIAEGEEGSATESQTSTEGESGTESQTTPTPILLTAEQFEIYKLEAGHTYVVMLSVPKEVTASRGYCDILVDGLTVCRTQIIENADEENFQFTIIAEREASLMVLPKWGVPAENGVQPVANGHHFTIAATGSTADVPASTEPVTEPTQPVEPTQPTDSAEPTEPAEPATQPTESATEPATQPTESDSNNQ